MSSITAVRCPNCTTLFGYADEHGRIAIKHRDLYRIIHGSVEGPCRKCSTLIKWESPRDPEAE